MVKGAVTVIENPYGGCIHIEEGEAVIYLQQEYMEAVGYKIVKSIRVTGVSASVERLARYEAGQVLDGNIYIKQSLVPVDYSDPTAFLLWENDQVARTSDGQAIYQYKMYSRNIEEHDEIVPRERVISH